MEHIGGMHVSIYMPTVRLGRDAEQNKVLFKDLVRKAERELELQGRRPADARDLMEAAWKIESDELFWRAMCDGLVVFLAGGFVRAYKLPLSFKEAASVNDSFEVTQLLPLLVGDGSFFVLALSQDMARLLQGTRYSVDVVDPEGLPKGLADAMKFEQVQDQRFVHTVERTGAPGGRGVTIYHGHGADKDEARARVLEYFRKVDAGLHELLKDESSPLILAGVDELFGIYAEANTYGHLLSDGIPGSPDREKPLELHDKAWRILGPYFERGRSEAADRFAEMLGTGLASTNIQEIVPAAYDGRVDTAFVALGASEWGRFDKSTDTVEVEPERHPGDKPLLEIAARQTVLHDGTVYAVDRSDVPTGAEAAAIFRY
jgi:Bacterial archaeo-eukaryotic release factor family 3